jgi:tRNA dimethylallyltransferase
LLPKWWYNAPVVTLAADASPVTVTFQSWVGEAAQMKKLAADFHKAHPNITIKFLNVPADSATQKLTTQVAGGHPRPAGGEQPDLVGDLDGRAAPAAGERAAREREVAGSAARVEGDVEIVSVDSMLVYRGMDIGTAKPTPEERARVPHHLVDLVDPGEEFSVARFQPLARAAIAEVLGRGRPPLLVGGSGLYFQAVVDDFVFPPTDPAVRSRLEAEAAQVGLPELYRRLAAADPPAAARIQPGNLRRTVRALEVMELTGRPFSSFRAAMDAPVSRYRLTVLGLDPGPELLRARVAERVAAMAEAGLVEEVRRLAERPLSRTARQALGYKELLDAMEQGTPVAEALEAVVRRTRTYARRQLAWFRRDPRVRWSTLPPGPERVAWALEAYGKG